MYDRVNKAENRNAITLPEQKKKGEQFMEMKKKERNTI